MLAFSPRNTSVRWLAGFLAAGLIACTSETPSPTVDTPIATGDSAPLPLPIGVSADPSAFNERVATLPAPRVKTRKRAADGGGDSVSIAVAVYYTSPRIDPNNGPDTAIIIAKLTNADLKRKEKTYGLLPAGRAIYYVLVDKKPGTDSARLNLVSVPGPDTVGVVATHYQEILTRCHPDAVNPPFDVDFVQYKHPDPSNMCRKAVRTASHTEKGSLHLASTRLGRMLARVGAFFAPRAHAQGTAVEAGEIWIDCGGCCT